LHIATSGRAAILPSRVDCALQEFASLDSKEIVRLTAGLAVLSYLFETCEVFEH
jgi:hypothetical protein